MGKKKTTEQFIEEAKKIHGNKYDYSLVEYNGVHEKVKIICPYHGVFEQEAKSHLSNHGCPKCSKSNKKTTEQFIEEAKKIHGDVYDYSLVKYVNAFNKVKIICPYHGIFEQIPNSHLSGHGCPICNNINKKTTEQFIEEAKKVHGDEYDYSLVNYINNNTKIKIICPYHGVFEQIPKGHLSGKGCMKCAVEYRTLLNKKTTEQFIEEAKKIHGDEYDYSLVEYNGAHGKVKIICPYHGVFEQRASSHLSGNKCKKCNNLKMSLFKLKSTEEFINDAKIVHGDKYDYSLVEYINTFDKVKIICPYHGIFEQIPNSHLSDHGCPSCQKSKGELKIKKFLDDNNFIYIEQYKFTECRNILPLPFDFYLPVSNICIEYDGEQHFRRFRFEDNDSKLLERQQRDNIKTQFCLDNNIMLLRIKYTKIRSINEILENNLKIK